MWVGVRESVLEMARGAYPTYLCVSLLEAPVDVLEVGSSAGVLLPAQMHHLRKDRVTVESHGQTLPADDLVGHLCILYVCVCMCVSD